MNSKGILPKMAETFRLRIYIKLPRYMYKSFLYIYTNILNHIYATSLTFGFYVFGMSKKTQNLLAFLKNWQCSVLSWPSTKLRASWSPPWWWKARDGIIVPQFAQTRRRRSIWVSLWIIYDLAAKSVDTFIESVEIWTSRNLSQLHQPR